MDKRFTNSVSRGVSVLLISVVSVLLISSSSYAQTVKDEDPSVFSKEMTPPGPRDKQRSPRMFEKRPGQDQKPPFMDQVLRLTDEQKKTLESIRLKYGKLTLPVRNQMGEYMAKLRTVSTGDNVSLSKIESVIDDIGETKTKLMKLDAAMGQEFRKILTDEQRLAFDQRPVFGHRSVFDQKPGPDKMRR